MLTSQPEDHKVEDAVGRVGRYESLQHWAIAADMIDHHTPIPAGYRNDDQWQEEGHNYMTTQKGARTCPTPRGVGEQLGELCQQGGFSIWWDERQQKIPLLATRFWAVWCSPASR